MCLYQDIHAAQHYELLSVDAVERDKHICGHKILSSVDGEECLLHSCCRVLGHEVLFRCSGAGGGSGELCDNAMKEDVFVPPASRCVAKGGTDLGIGEVVEPSLSEGSPMTMEFWLEDQPGKVVLVYSEEVPGHEDKKKEVKPYGRWHRVLLHLRRKH
ncbi:hypothetical protein F4805DRAFT_70701 [Annulohypoxylon moriforme]|nr:hypothetical protein F4805DRAFT_70701 [Annulohypoxylon moriforme]